MPFRKLVGHALRLAAAASILLSLAHNLPSSWQQELDDSVGSSIEQATQSLVDDVVDAAEGAGG